MTATKQWTETSSPPSKGEERDEKTVRLITCNDAFQAHLIQGALENEGILSILHNEHTSGVLFGYSKEIAGVDVLVYENDRERALLLLEQNQMIPEQLRYCPRCGSDQIDLVLKKGHKMRAVVAAVVSALSVAPPGTEHWEYRCTACNARFEKPVAKI